MENDYNIDGQWDPRFETVAKVFEENFRLRHEVGASVAVILDGETVVDMWGGFRDKERRLPWGPHTVVALQSVVKGILALCAHILIDRGQLSLALPVAHYWPEFGQMGKENISVQELIAHHAGLIYPDHAEVGSFVNWNKMVEALIKQKPEWESGTKGAYHSSTYAVLVGELIKKVSGMEVEDFFAEVIGDPLGVEFYFKLNEDQLNDVADFLPNSQNSAFTHISTNEKLNRAWRVLPNMSEIWNSPFFRTNVLPHGHGNARGMARLFGALACGGSLNGVTLLRRETLNLAVTPQWEGICNLLDMPYRMSLGLVLNTPSSAYFGPNPASFGASGAGGATSFADPDTKLGFGYAMNHMCQGMALGPRSAALIEAVYACL